MTRRVLQNLIASALYILCVSFIVWDHHTNVGERCIIILIGIVTIWWIDTPPEEQDPSNDVRIPQLFESVTDLENRVEKLERFCKLDK